jgi:sulfite exporter TauE/SafE
MNQILLAFIAGITTGGISCFAVQGGLLAGTLANQKREDQKKSLLMFLLAKTVSHFILGALLGLLGSSLIISSKTQGIMQIIAGVFILAVATKFADIHPIFKRFTLTPPKSFFRILRIQSKSQGLITPAIIGFLTVLIPCGITQAMMLLSVTSGSFLYGGLILLAFVLGTTPLFFILGLASEKVLSVKPLRILAVVVITYLGLLSINTGQTLRGSIHTWQNYRDVLLKSDFKTNQKGQILLEDGKQVVTIDVKSTSYKASNNILKLGVPVKLILESNDVFSCARAFTIPSLNISKLLPSTGTEIIEFTPTKLGKLTFTCSMGMYSGYFNVVE